MKDDGLEKLRHLTGRLAEPGQVWCEPGSVLVVEDDPDCREVLRSILVKAGYKVYRAEDYREAEDAAGLCPAVALIDLRLPGGADGFEVRRMLRERSPGTKCVILTAYSTESTAIEAVNLDCAGYFQKPYDASELLARLRSILGEQSQ